MSTAVLASPFINRFLMARLSRDDDLRGRPFLDFGNPVIIVIRYLITVDLLHPTILAKSRVDFHK